MAEAIQELEAGRDLDALIAKRIFGRTARAYRSALGETLYIVDDSARRTSPSSTSANLVGGAWERGYDETGELVEFYGRICPAFSSDIAAAWEVAERLQIGVLPWEHNGVMGFVAGYDDDASALSWIEHILYDSVGTWSWAETAPLAICRAALKVQGEQSTAR